MSEQEKPVKEVEGELEHVEGHSDKLNSAKQHLTAVVGDVKQFIDEDLADLAKDTVDKLDETVTSGITSAADAMINVP
ncbi:MAG: hypothetical protein U9Q19_06620 [Pseudomonadota bacterium]|nr:hypothetical protein [Pseudomonadota bacterium]